VIVYGHRYFRDVRPQVLPFDEYGRRYTYHYELPLSVRLFIVRFRIAGHAAKSLEGFRNLTPNVEVAIPKVLERLQRLTDRWGASR
jgi:hypothetical protein